MEDSVNRFLRPAAKDQTGAAIDQLRNPRPPARTIKVLLFIETVFIRGAAKTLLMFLDGAQELTDRDRVKPFSFSLATFHRGSLPADKPPTEFLEAVQQRGVKTYLIRERHRWDPRVLRSIRRIVAETDPDIIQTNNVKSHALIKAAGAHRSRSWVAFHHGYTSTDFTMRCYNMLDRWSLRSAERVVVPCRAFCNQLLSCGVKEERTRILHNAGIIIPAPPFQEVRALRTRFGFQSNAKVLLSIGRMSREKGHIDLIRAMKVLSEKYPAINCHLILLGFGFELPRLRAEVEKRALDFCVTFATDEKDVIPFLYLADVFVLPSHSEGSPHVILEAMGAGVPIVATSVGGIPEILRDGRTATLVEPKNPQFMADALVPLLQSPSLCRGFAREAQQVLETTFSPQTYVRQLFGIYSEVLSYFGSLPDSACDRGGVSADQGYNAAV